ncbi:FBD-associated F-box protein At5g27750-like [Papaver somniferum]|uniref:FBD-associated F-box protein At5g27750-like n=1 Tax=Papaver somniferum TaxID=3469 RepID=UPI000E6F88B5|nr:FBD-associated F-box protein At5g27750-like [Papaver somniferum]
MTESTNKRTRNNMEEEGVGGEDRISRLPEPIIHHILTLLPTKCAFSTTILSKGWNNLWITSVPVDVIPKSVEKLCNVKLLKLSDSVFEKLELAGVLSASFPTFNNLNTLEVSFIKTRLVKPLFTFLQFSPNLESLVFSGVCGDKINEDAFTLDVVPHCLLMNLKSIKFQYFKGQLKELDLVQLFLQNARVLQTVIIEISSDHFVNSDKKKHMCD